MNPIINVNQTSELSKYLKNQYKRIVLVGGCFDILHIGHIALLEGAKKEGDILVVMLESDETIAEKKGEGRPLHTQLQRAQVLLALEAVDYVILLTPHMTNEQYDMLVKAIQPDIIATTQNDPGWEHKKRQAEQIHARLVAVTHLIDNVSTSRIISQLQKEL